MPNRNPFTIRTDNRPPLEPPRRGPDVHRPEGNFDQVVKLSDAQRAIDAKAADLGWAGAPNGTTMPVGTGFLRHFAECDIYYSPATGAHEIHGDIRKKYDHHGGAGGHLGLPTTDETGTPDGLGVFNHFVTGSIYFTPNTGPMMVRGKIRDHWAQQGWETGPLGYPVEDEHRYVTASPDGPVIRWSLFERGAGAVMETADGVASALPVIVTPDQLRAVVRSRFDAEIHKSPDNVGLQAPVETVAVSNWEYGFWKARDRVITFRLHGFRDNGLAPDTDLEITVGLRFGLTWQPAFSEEALTKTIVVELAGLSVKADGLGSGEIANSVAKGIQDAFAQPLRIADLPTGTAPDLIGIMTGADGSLQILVNPLPNTPGNDIGRLRQMIVQNKVNELLAQ